MTDVNLLPCPFCGGEARLISSTSSTVQCQNDQCIIGDPAPFNDFSHRADAITAWNTRAATIPDPQAFMEAARGMREALEDIDRLARDRIKDGDEMGQRCWLIGLVDIEREARTALAAFDAAQGEQ